MTEPGHDCPECGTHLVGRRCVECGWTMAPVKGEEKPKAKYSCWTCDRCGAYSPGHPTLRDDRDGLGLCSACHFKLRIEPFKSNATDLCDAPECEGTAAHKISRHIAEFRAHVARITERMVNL